MIALLVLVASIGGGLSDSARLSQPGEVRLGGFLGERVDKNAAVRLLQVDEDELLAGFRKRPGAQAWIGEHVGKFLDAASRAYGNNRDPKLRAKVERVVTGLLATQEPDGYLGTYAKGQRFGLYPGADWDVWVHKYDLLGLLAVHRYVGDARALPAARRVANLLIDTFGPEKRSIVSAGTHMGMAATSVLEPMVLLYEATGDPRYLAFARRIVDAYDEPGGPGVLRSLLTGKKVAKTANGKAYEMLSNVSGLCELARVTGDRRYLEAALNAWADVKATQLYLTGTASYGEHFHADHDLPNEPSANVGETCVTVTWMQLNAQLLRLTGEARFAAEIERSAYNHLSGSQKPDGAEWCYYTALEGRKPYGRSVNCCLSSGPRGMSLLPELAVLRFGPREIGIPFAEPLAWRGTVDGVPVLVRQESSFPGSGGVRISVESRRPVRLAIRVRVPDWVEGARVTGAASRSTKPAAGWLVIPERTWKRGDRLAVQWTIPFRLREGTYSNAGLRAATYGPFVLAYDEAFNKMPARRAVLEPGTRLEQRSDLRFVVQSPGSRATLVPFAEAGASGSRYVVWCPAKAPPDQGRPSVLELGQEFRSRTGNVSGSILDDSPGSFVVTFDGTPQSEAYFGVRLPRPTAIRRVVFLHGRTFHDGGWFDTTTEPVRVEAQTVPGGSWIRIGNLDAYPRTSPTDPRGLRAGQPFELRLAERISVVALRVVGRPAHGGNPAQAFASCGGLRAYDDESPPTAQGPGND